MDEETDEETDVGAESRSKEEPSEIIIPSGEGAMANEGAGAVGLQKSEVGSIPDESLLDQCPDSNDSGVSILSKKYREFQTTRRQTVHIPCNPRRYEIINLPVVEMRGYIREEIPNGTFGKLYRAKTFGPAKLECVIKEIKLIDEDSQKSYEKEVFMGTILHPFINPIIAYGSDTSKERVSYLMFPLMKNRRLRYNINRENRGESLCPPESNSVIWTRCIYQVVQVLKYLNNRVPAVRGPIFHGSLSSKNILLDENFNVRVGDFGTAVEVRGECTDTCIAVLDVNRLGVVMLEILTGKEEEAEGYPLNELYTRHTKDRTINHLKTELNKRADSIPVAKWISKPLRDEMAKIALEALTLDETKREELFQRLEDYMEEARQRKKQLENLHIEKEKETTKLKEKRRKTDLNERLSRIGRDRTSLLGYRDETHDKKKRKKWTKKLKILENEEKNVKTELKKLEERRMFMKDQLLTTESNITELEKQWLLGKELYRKPVKLDRCVSCCINPPANLSLKGELCAESESPCRPFCIPCLIKSHTNPLLCPEHGKTRPPLGDHVYGVFVAGNDVKGMETNGRFYSAEEVAETFMRDVDKFVEVLTAKYPCVLGADPKHLKVVKPATPGIATQMEVNIRDAFLQIRDMIERAHKNNQDMIERAHKNNHDQNRDRLQDSLFIFYFSGHCDETNGLMLGSETENTRAFKKWIKKMLHNILGVDQVLVILDCCHADSQNFADTQGLQANTKAKKRSGCWNSKVSIFHLSSCDEREIIKIDDQGSYFTSILLLGLKGFNRRVSRNGTFQFCDQCGGPVQYCDDCEEAIKHPLEAMKQNHDNGTQGSESNGSVEDKDKCHNCEARKQTGADIKVPCVEFHDECSKAQFVTVSSLQKFIQAHFNHRGYHCNTVANIQRNGDKILLAYYSSDKPCFSIYLTDSTDSDNSSQKAYHLSMDCNKQDLDLIKQDIITYTVKKTVYCDVLTFHQSYGETVEKSSLLVAIYPMDGTDKDTELTTLDSMYNFLTTSRKLEARVRENIKDLSNAPNKCPIRLKTITKVMVHSFRANCHIDYTDYLRITQDVMEIQIRKIKKILHIAESTDSNKDFRSLMDALSAALVEIIPRKKREAFLEFHLYDEFSVVEIV